MLIGEEGISNDVITLARFKSLFTFALVSASRWLAERELRESLLAGSSTLKSSKRKKSKKVSAQGDVHSSRDHLFPVETTYCPTGSNRLSGHH